MNNDKNYLLKPIPWISISISQQIKCIYSK